MIMIDSVEIARLAARLQEQAAEAPAESLPALIGALESAKALAWSRLLVPRLPEENTEPFLTAEELAPLIKLPVHAVRDRGRRGLIPSVRIGRYVRFQRSAVIETLKADAVPRSTHPVAAENPRRVSRLRGRCPASVQDDPG